VADVDCLLCTPDREGRHDPACALRGALPRPDGAQRNGGPPRPHTAAKADEADARDAVLSAAYAEALERAKAFATL
jgi:hypothetical protein